jgi:hypothetical protein
VNRRSAGSKSAIAVSSRGPRPARLLSPPASIVGLPAKDVAFLEYFATGSGAIN